MMWKLVCGEGGRGVGWGRGVGELRRGYDIGAEAWRGGRSGQYGPGLAFFKYDTFRSKKKSEVTTLLLGTLLTIPADFLHPMTKYMLATGL